MILIFLPKSPELQEVKALWHLKALLSFVAHSLFPSTVWGDSCITRLLGRCPDWVTKTWLSWPWCFGNLHHWCVFAFIVIELLRDLLLFFFSKHRLLREQLACTPGDLTSVFAVWEPTAAWLYSLRMQSSCFMENHGDPDCGIVTIFPVSFVWEVIGFSCFSLQRGSAFVSILSCTEIVVEAMYRVLVGGCRVALVRSGGVCPCWAQPLPAHPTRLATRHSWALQPQQQPLRKSPHEKGQNAAQSVRSEGRVGKAALQTPGSEEEMFQVSKQRFALQEITLEQTPTLQPVGRTTLWQVDIPEGAMVPGEPMVEQVDPEVL